MPQILGPKVLELRDVIVDAFTLDEFDDMLLLLNLNRARVSTAVGQDTIVRDVIGYFNRRFQIPVLLRASRMANPHHPDLLALEFELGKPNLAIVEHVGDKQQRVQSNLELERYIRGSHGLKEPRSWREQMAAAESAICRIEVLPLTATQQPIFGTGFLVAPDVVITNYHVIEQVEQGLVPPSNVQVRFDFALLADGVTTDPGTIYKLSVNEWLLEYSSYSGLDQESDPAQDPSPDELDFALLKVAGKPGEEPVSGSNNPATQAKPRGFLRLHASAYDFPPNSALFILQHPVGAPLKLALDTQAIIHRNESGTRVRYRTNTDHGSSGAPCFSDNWELVAMHHAGDPNYADLHHAQYNQGIPIAAIITYLEQRNKRQLIA